MRLVVGSDGKIGKGICNYLSLIGDEFVGTTRRNNGGLFLDLSQDVNDFDVPDVSVAYLCAGITSLKACRDQPESKTINVNNTLTLAKRLIERNVFVVFLSSNLVYDGTEPFQYGAVNPKTEYGNQKVMTEKGLAALGNVAIVRCTKVLGRDALITKWRDSLKAGKEIHPFIDMVMSPVTLTFVTHVMHRIGELRIPGIFQISGTNDITYAQAAYALAEAMEVSSTLVRPIGSKESGIELEHVPKFTTLNDFMLKPFRRMPVPKPDVAVSLVT